MRFFFSIKVHKEEEYREYLTNATTRIEEKRAIIV